jgi:hypothetical protein
MLAASVTRVLRTVPDDAVILDVGGGVQPFTRADWVMDALPYEKRGELGRSGPAEERFTASTWVMRDFCDREPWPFDDDQIDFAICSHTLEDVRDPVWMCAELNRVAKAGYIEVPSRLEEQSYGFQGAWTGWSHHRWLIDIDEAGASIEFVHKPHLINGREPDRFPPEFRNHLSREERVQTLWWSARFSYRERLFWSSAELDAYTRDFVADELAKRGLTRRELTRSRRLRGRLRRRLRG